MVTPPPRETLIAIRNVLLVCFAPTIVMLATAWFCDLIGVGADVYVRLPWAAGLAVAAALCIAIIYRMFK